MTSCVHRTIRGALLKILWHIKKTFVAKKCENRFCSKKNSLLRLELQKKDNSIAFGTYLIGPVFGQTGFQVSHII